MSNTIEIRESVEGDAGAIESLYRAIDEILDRCARDPDCDERFPEIDLDFESIRARLDAAPVSVTLLDPTTGRRESLEFGPNELAAAIRLLAYQPRTIAILPLVIHEAANDNFVPLAAQFQLTMTSLADSLSLGMHNAVVCSEDLPFVDRDAIDFGGALEAGVAFASGYPGTPSSEVTDTFAQIAAATGIVFEYSVNEKIALEMAFAASLAGARSICAMKHLGLMYAGDPDLYHPVRRRPRREWSSSAQATHPAAPAPTSRTSATSGKTAAPPRSWIRARPPRKLTPWPAWPSSCPSDVLPARIAPAHHNAHRVTHAHAIRYGKLAGVAERRRGLSCGIPQRFVPIPIQCTPDAPRDPGTAGESQGQMDRARRAYFRRERRKASSAVLASGAVRRPTCQRPVAGVRLPRRRGRVLARMGGVYPLPEARSSSSNCSRTSTEAAGGGGAVTLPGRRACERLVRAA